MRRVTRDATLGLNRGMLIRKRTLFVGVTLDTSGIGAGSQSGLFKFKAAVRIVTIAALHGAFENFVVEG